MRNRKFEVLSRTTERFHGMDGLPRRQARNKACLGRIRMLILSQRNNLFSEGKPLRIKARPHAWNQQRKTCFDEHLHMQRASFQCAQAGACWRGAALRQADEEARR